MKKYLLILSLSMLIIDHGSANSLLPECKGNDIKAWVKKFTKVRKWTNCHGNFTGPNGAKYVGEFYKGKFHGKGTYTANGRKYVGEWKNHDQHGSGTYKYGNGDKYVGEWKKGKYHGQGIYTYSDGTIEKGTFKKGKFIN
tara:strand:+ start:59 stop:478 length:420 start_codon:yes stop_codon:yes gene_type:complete